MVNPHGKTYGICKNKCLVEVSPKEDVVHKSGDETIGGNKAFTGNVTIGTSGSPKQVSLKGDLVIDGNISQSGANYETHAEEFYTKQDKIILRDGAVSGLGVNDRTGFTFKKYDGTNDGNLVVGADGTAYVGDTGDLQPILTRAPVNSMVAGKPIVWDSTGARAVTTNAIDDALALKADKTTVNDGLALKADKTEVALKADKTTVNDGLALKADKTEVTAHTERTDNPHGVTKAQVGLGSYPTSPADIGISTATQTALNGKANSSALTGHTNSKSNPHVVTKAQVGLGNVDNTSDANKPISTAVQTALNAKQAKLTFDSAPTAGSANPVTSSGVKTALDAKQGTITGGATTIVSDNLTPSRALVSDNNGKVAASNVTATELGRLYGITSNIQTQLNNKANETALPTVATDAEAIAGTDDSKFMSPKKVKLVVDGIGGNGGNTPSIATYAEAIAGTDDSKMMTPLKVQQAIQPLVAPLFPPVNCTTILTMYKNDTSITVTPLINAVNCTNLNEVFRGCTKLVTVGYIHMPNATNASSMFYRCSSLTTIPMLHTSSVTNMGSMFDGCSSLTTIPLLDISSATSMSGMFNGCESLTSVTFQCDDVRPYGSWMFSGTPIAAGNGYIFVPDSLVQAYKIAEGWSTWASVIFGHSDKANM